MRTGKRRVIKQYPVRVPRRDGIPAPDIFVPKKAPIRKPAEVDK